MSWIFLNSLVRINHTVYILPWVFSVHDYFLSLPLSGRIHGEICLYFPYDLSVLWNVYVSLWNASYWLMLHLLIKIIIHHLFMPEDIEIVKTINLQIETNFSMVHMHFHGLVSRGCIWYFIQLQYTHLKVKFEDNPQCSNVRRLVLVIKNNKGVFVVKWSAAPNNKTTCAQSEYSDQSEHPPSLARVFAVRLTDV